MRTTCILPALKEKYKASHLTWLTMDESEEVLAQNPYVDKILPISYQGATLEIQLKRYDLVINLDNSALNPNCMERINPKTVFDSIMRLV